ncbi:hypothetical protein QYE76_062625 [Lolium multiflorum]|uniref:CCHC-type domain-containing protein n=1 Tax=Lolium multiflorum TaxID=4521 RepID=A0AAD8S5K2_LOLMU|nr:hypothetical protein QYE76_062625 [Lolium multiflorum]
MDMATKVWMAIKTMFATQSKTRVSNLRVALAKMKKENMTSAQFFTKMKGLTDELAAAGRPIDEEELMEYLLAGLDDTYNPLFAAIGVNGAEDLTVSDLYAQVVTYENRIELLSDTGGSVNAASLGRGGNRRRGHYGGRRGGRGYGVCGEGGRHQQRGGRGNGRRGGGMGGGNRDRDTIVCQICGKPGHDAWKCWHRYSDNEDEEEKNANMASYGVDTTWYGDTGATDHITGELNKLTMKEKYQGRDQIHTANGEGEDSVQNSAEVRKNRAETRLLSRVHHGGTSDEVDRTSDEADSPRIGQTSDNRGASASGLRGHPPRSAALQPRTATSPSPSFSPTRSDSGCDTRRDHTARDQRDPGSASSPRASTDGQDQRAPESAAQSLSPTGSFLGSLQAQQENLGGGSSARSAPVRQPAPTIYKTRSKTGNIKPKIYGRYSTVRSLLFN